MSNTCTSNPITMTTPLVDSHGFHFRKVFLLSLFLLLGESQSCRGKGCQPGAVTRQGGVEHGREGEIKGERGPTRGRPQTQGAADGYDG